MANDSNQTQGAQHDDNMGVSAAHDDAGIVQVAEATGTTGANAPAANGGAAPAALPDQTINVVIPQGATVVRVPVAAGDTIDLPPPFNSGAILDPSHGNGAKEGDGNLAIKVGDVTVILQGYIEASNDPTHPVTIEAADHQAVDIATVLASTDPNANIPTAAGPAAGAQGADNGHFFADFATGPGLGGLNAIGVLDATDLSYKLIDNSIRQDLPNTLLAAGPGLSITVGPALGGGHEGLLHDPAHSAPGDFGTFLSQYEASYNSGGTGPQPGWSDFTGTQATNNATFQDFLTQNEQTTEVTANNLSSPQGSIVLNGIDVSSMTSNGSPLEVASADNGQTLFVTRASDGALIFVVHAEQIDGSHFNIETILVNRLDDTNGDGTEINGNVDFTVYDGAAPQQGSDETPTGPTPPSASGSVGITFVDDAPVAGDNTYKDVNNPGDAHPTTTQTHDYGQVDEDWLSGGNKDHDADGKDNHNSNGDTIGGASVTGMVGINFGADGPAGETVLPPSSGIKDGDTLKTNAIDTNHPALALDIPAVGSAFTVGGQQLHSDQNPLVVLEADGTHIIVGYETEVNPGNGDGPVASALAAGETPVFELTLDTNPDSSTFGQFTFTLLQGIDENGQQSGKEGNLPADITFNVTGYDDDGDKATTTIHIQVNDDVPEVPNQHNDPKTPSTSDGIAIVDEDYLAGGYQGGDPTTDKTTGTSADGVPGGGTVASGHVNVNFGGDGVGSFGIDSSKIVDGAAVQVTGSNGTHDLKTDSGETVLYSVTTVAGHEIVTGVTAGGTEVFKLDLNVDTTDTANVGSWTFTLEAPVSHPDGFSEDDLLASFGIKITDGDGSVATGSIKIDINDDSPVAVADNDTVNHAAGSITTGNVVTGVGDADSNLKTDHFGADQPAVGAAEVVNATGVGSTSVNATTGEITVHGAFGDLVIEKDGSYTYTVGAAGIVQGQQDVFTYTIKDADGDTSDTTLTLGTSTVPDITQETPAGTPGVITVNEAGLVNGVNGATVTGSDPAAATSATGSFKIDSHGEGFNYLHVGGKDVPLTDGNASIQVSTDHGIMTITHVTDNKDGSYDISYSYTLNAPIDEATADNGKDTQTLPTVPIEVQDKSGDTASDHITVHVVDDAPTATNDSISIGAPTVFTSTVSVEANDTFGADGKDSKGGVVGIAKGDTGADSASLSDVHGTYGTLHMNADGSYTYTRDSDAPTSGDIHDVFTYTIQDGDGDTSHAKLDIDINDHGVTVTPPPPPHDGDNPITLQTTGTAVFESGLNPDGSNAAANTETTSGKVMIDAKDGIGTITVGGTSIDLTDVTKTGPIHGTHGDITITGWNPTTGELDYSYTLTKADSTPNAPGNNFDTKGEDFTVVATDTDGDSNSGHVVIGIVDDVPTAQNDAVSIGNTVAVYTSTVATNVEANDTFGADGKDSKGGVVGIAKGDTGADSASLTDIKGDHGTLHMNADGSYTYTRDPADKATGEVHDIFTYTIKDADGDTSHAKLDIDITDNPVTVTPPPPPKVGDNPVTLNAGGTAVYESALGTDATHANAGGVLGSNPTATTETTAGHVMIVAKDGVGSITVGGTTVNLADVSKTGAIHGTHGDLTITGWNSTTGELDYSYTLTKADNTPGAAGNNLDLAGDSFTVVAKDTDGDSDSGNVVIGIVDDVPTAHNDAVSIGNAVTAYTSTAATNVEANDIFGADGKAAGGGVVGIAKGDTGADSASLTNVHGTYGTLHMNADGSYTYTRDNNAPTAGDVHDVFTYTIKDADGDTSHAKLDIDINDSGVTVTPPPPPGVNDDPATLTTSPTTVFESALGTDATHANAGGFLGTNPTSTDETTTGHITVTAKDGVGSIDIDGTTVNLANASSTGTIHGDHGDLSITGWNATTGQLDYSYTLTKADTTHTAGNDIDVNGEDFKITVKDSDGDMGTGDLKIGIVDDVPTAANGTKELAPSGGQFNVLLILDTSGSMREDSGVLNTATGKDYTKLQLEGQAVKDLLNGYPADTMVQIATFSTDGHQTSPTWMTVAQAEAKVDALVGTGKDPFSDGQTNYQAALTNGETAFNTPGAITGATNVAYFLSDGQPNEPGPLTAGQTSQWTTFLANHDVNAYALGLGPDTDSTTLNPVAYNGHTGANTDAIIVDDLNDLASQIEHTLPTSSSGNLVGDLGGHYGADAAGHVDVGLVTLGGAGQTVVTDAAAHTATVTMTQGVLVIHTDTGDYTYTPAAGQHQSEVDVQFQLEDSEGDKSTTATLKLIPAADTAPMITSNNGNDLALSVAENTTTVTTVQAHDPDAGDKLTYSITGGADQALFTINATTGAVVFKSAPDFEHPTDNGANNIYNITVAATDLDGKSDTQNIAITVTNVANEAAPVAVADHIFTNVTGDVVVQDAWLLSNDTDADSVHSALKITDPVAASAGQSGFFNDLPDHHSGNSTVTFDLDTGTKSGQLNNGDSTGLDYTLQDQSLTGNSGHVTVTYETGATINGSTGDDILIGNNAALHGGHGNDTLVGTGSNDLLDYSDVSTDWSVTLSSTGSGTSNIDGNDTFQGIDGVVGGSGFNTVVLGDGSSYSHTALHDNFRSVEVLDLGKNGTSDNVTLATGSAGLRPEDVISMTDSNHALYITGDSKDIVNVKTGGSGADFALAGTVTNNNAGDHIPDGTYTHYTATVSGTHVDLYVENTVHTQTTNG